MENQDDVVLVRKEGDIREGIISEYGFDAEVDVERIDKLVAKELDHDKKLSSAIGAKIKHRKEAEELRGKIPPEIPKQEAGLSQDDVFYIAKADIHEDDVKEILSYAKKMEISAKEAHNFYRPILKERAEERKTAEATQTKGGARSIVKETADSLISQANKGVEIDPEKLADARMNKLLNK